MKVLVTGSEGFVGKVLVRELVQSGTEVVGLDRVSNPLATWKHLTCDLQQPIELESDYYDVVIHCAAAKGDWCISDEKFHNDNVAATQNLIDYLLRSSVKRIIHFSTVSIYSRDDCAEMNDSLY